jgi:hypothetical protein
MASYVLITHTPWPEAPRVRHQIARLVAGAGHNVWFFERATYPWQESGPTTEKVEPGITVVRTKRLMHHQLRVAPPLDWANAALVTGGIVGRMRDLGIDPGSTVINFAHDYSFLRRIFPRNRIVTVYHDDIEAQTRFPWFGHVTRSIRDTCRMSDEVLALSTPLVERLRRWCEPRLFLPWAIRPYAAPTGDAARRDRLLYWGFIDVSMDTERVRAVCEHLARTRPSWRVMLVGPTQSAARRAATLAQLEGIANLDVLDQHPLDALPMDRVAAAFIPYRRKGDTDATELPNKSLQLLSYGVPILKSGMPAMIRRPFILPLDEGAGIEEAVASCVANFDAWQPGIRAFLEENSPAARLHALGVEPVR